MLEKMIHKLHLPQYNIIAADPPWHYDDKQNAGNRGAEHKYHVMTDQDIIALGSQVQMLAAQDCALFVWFTSPKTDLIKELFDAWGFQFKGKAFCWVKTTKHGKLFWGMGRCGSRANTEDCWMGFKGNPKRLDAGVHEVIMSPVQAHSQKPDEARQRMVKLFGDVPRLELFARDVAPGWDAMGNELGTGDIRDSLPGFWRPETTIKRNEV